MNHLVFQETILDDGQPQANVYKDIPFAYPKIVENIGEISLFRKFDMTINAEENNG